MTLNDQSNIRMIRWVLFIGSVVMVVKFIAYFITHSTAILTDALESIINVVAGAFAWYSLHLASKPKDRLHPYGHGKIEFISAGFEGGLVLIAAIGILIKSVDNLLHPQVLHQLETGIGLSVISGIINFMLGRTLIRAGKKSNSITLVADGRHLMTDTVSSAGLVIGLLVITLTGMVWLDNVIAIVFGLLILITGYKLIRKSLAGLMDEADEETLTEMVAILTKYRSDKWIDIHNLRVLRYGAFLHIDCHITLPWYEDLQSSHQELKKVEDIINKAFNQRVEIFIHPDPCLPASCSLCALEHCRERKFPFKQQVAWELNNLLSDSKHHL
ncbi:MAG: cation diffusion facilitator family transporter [Bacteroidia bacterium]|jgi:cation diffusion facilitator family transporter